MTTLYPEWGTLKGDKGHKCYDCGKHVYTLHNGIRSREAQHSGPDGLPCVDANGRRLRRDKKILSG